MPTLEERILSLEADIIELRNRIAGVEQIMVGVIDRLARTERTMLEVQLENRKQHKATQDMIMVLFEKVEISQEGN